MIARYLAFCDRLCTLAAGLAATSIALVFLLGITEIAARAIFSTSLGVALEFGEYLTAASLLLGAGEALRQGTHIRITLLAERLAPRYARILDLAATLAGLLVAIALAVALMRYAFESLHLDARSYFPTATPLWVPQGLLALGPSVLALAFSARLVRLVRGEEAGS